VTIAQWDVDLTATTDELEYRRVPWPRGDTVILRPRLTLDRRPITLDETASVQLYVRDSDGTWYLTGVGSVTDEAGRVSVAAEPIAVQETHDVLPFVVAITTSDGRSVRAAGAFDVLDAPSDASAAEPITLGGVADVPAGESQVTVTFTEQSEPPAVLCTIIIPDGAPLLTCAVTGVTTSSAMIVLSAPAPSDGYQIAWRIM